MDEGGNDNDNDNGFGVYLCCNYKDNSIELLSQSQYTQAMLHNPHYSNIWDVFTDDIGMFNEQFLPQFE